MSLTNDELLALADQAGVGNLTEVESCIRDERFADWLDAATTRAMGTGPVPVRNSQVPVIRGTPTVLVNGQEYTGRSPAELAAFVASLEEVDAAE